jgi:hypothetical protein
LSTFRLPDIARRLAGRASGRASHTLGAATRARLERALQHARWNDPGTILDALGSCGLAVDPAERLRTLRPGHRIQIGYRDADHSGSIERVLGDRLLCNADHTLSIVPTAPTAPIRSTPTAPRRSAPRGPFTFDPDRYTRTDS